MTKVCAQAASEKTKQYMPWLVAVALFMENLDATIVNTAVPTMAQQLEVQPLSLKAVLTSYTICLAVFIPISGWMADRFGTKKVFTWAVCLFTLGSLFCGLAVSIPMLVVARVVQGIGGAMMTPVGRLALVRTFPRSEMLAAMNFVVIPALIGPLLGPFAGGLIVHWLPWRTIFFVNLPIGGLGLWLINRHMPDYRDDDVARLDYIGFVLFGGGIALLSYVLEVFGEHRLPPGPILGLLAVSVALLAAYYQHGRRVPNPVMRLTLFDVRTFNIAVLGGIITRLGIGGMPFLLPLLYQIGMGFPAWQAGLLTIPQAIAAITMKVLSKSILARFGHRQVLLLNTILFGSTIMVFSLIGPGVPIWCILLLSFTQGFFSALQFTSMNTLVYADIRDAEASMANSIASTAQMMSLSFGVAFASLVTGWYIGHIPQSDTVNFVRALHHSYLTLGGVTIVSSLMFWRLQPNDGNNVSNRTSTPEGENLEAA
ncbi:MAG TPA: DHA2 family efflux MFS transporter permease subunit [Candidatus Didemnitutus sp.]|nr:DHA2 family efflux MFS transporter permease subunit [Candidatus Didemnitutus sp.]